MRALLIGFGDPMKFLDSDADDWLLNVSLLQEAERQWAERDRDRAVMYGRAVASEVAKLFKK